MTQGKKRRSMKINRRNSTPSYMQVADFLRTGIAEGRFRPGSQLPTEQELIRRSKLSRVTVRRGIEVLAKEGLVVRKQGLGTFVPDAINQELSSVQTQTEVLLARGIAPEITVLSFGAVYPPENVRATLRLNQNEQLLQVERLYQRSGEPFALLRIFLPLSVREHADVLRSADVPTETTYTMWEQKVGIRLKGASHTIRATRADEGVAAALGVDAGDPVLTLDRVTYAEDGRPLEFITFHYHCERYEFSIMIPRRSPNWPFTEKEEQHVR
jgi:GntR family transcriptional regulator